jgi:DNA-directed RNA polymerase sigma subunit (sigma70/sigma32)
MKDGEKPATVIDYRLYALLALTPRGVSWSIREISALTGVDKRVIWRIEQSALNKLRAGERARTLEGWR